MQFLRHSSIRYLLVGAFNTLFGYFNGVVIYKLLIGITSIFIVGFISNIVSITISFVTYKTLVFQTKGKWLREYAKCCLVYGVMGIISIFFLWLYLNQFGMNIWLSQGLVILSTTLISFLSHKNFTFKNEK
jgi:putative flippase GtrA